MLLLWTLLRQSFINWRRDNAARFGAALAFYSVLSLGPLILLIFAAAAWFWGRSTAQEELVHSFTLVVGAEGIHFVKEILGASIDYQRPPWLAVILSAITLLFSAANVSDELHYAFDVIWKIPAQRRKLGPEIIRRLVSLMRVILCAALIILSLFATAGTAALLENAGKLSPILPVLLPFADFVVSLAVMTMLFAFTFKVIPGRKTPGISIWSGAMLTAILFFMGKLAIALYLARAGVASAYGAAGSFIAILIWVYYTSQILFFGAEFSRVCALRYEGLKNAKMKSTNPL